MRSIFSALLVLVLLPAVLSAQPRSLAPIDFANRPLIFTNDATATGWGPSVLGINASGIDLVGVYNRDELATGSINLAGGFIKLGPLGFGTTSYLDDSLPDGSLAPRRLYYLGVGSPLIEDVWVGAGVRWRDAGGFVKSGQWAASVTVRPEASVLLSGTAENLTNTDSAGLRWNLLGSYRLFDAVAVTGGLRSDPSDTVGGRNPLGFTVGAVASIGRSLHIGASYDLGGKATRFGIEYFFDAGGDDFRVGVGAIGQLGNGTGLERAVGLLRYTSIAADATRPGVDDPFTPSSSGTRDRRGWAPERSYTPTGLNYRYSTTDADVNADALRRPCSIGASDYDTPIGLSRKVASGGSVYRPLHEHLRRLTSNPSDIYGAIRREFYSARVRNRELMRGDSLALATRGGYTIGIQSVDLSRLPEASVVVQVTDANGRNVTGLKQNDFFFRDTSLKITSVSSIDSGRAVPIDIVMIVDCSGSMRDEIEAVRRNVESFVAAIERRGADARLGGVLYGSIVYDTLHPTDDLNRFKEFARNAEAIGGDEITSLAIQEAATMDFRPDAQRLFVLITDDWAVQDNARLGEADLTEMLWNAGARLYTIGDPCKNNGAVMTRLTLGREYNITSPFNSILDDIGTDVTTLYRVTYQSRIRQEEIVRPTLLRGRVRDETGRPVDARFVLRGPKGSPGRIAINGTTGAYETEIEDPGTYSAEITSDRAESLRESVDLTGVKKGDTVVRDFTLRLPPTRVAGTVRTETNATIAAEVRIDDAETGRRIATLRTGSDGAFDTLLAEGRRYRLSAHVPDYIPDAAELDARGVERGARMRQDLRVTSIDAAIRTGATFRVRNIFFDVGKWELKPESYVELDRVVALLGEYPTIKVEIGAHTDATGTDQNNQILSENRARSVAEYLASHGVDAARLRSRGYGESVPVSSNDTEEGRAMNRRVEFKLVK